MLATIGFAVVGCFFAAFAVTFQRLVVARTKLHLFEFGLAYGLLALAFWLWAAASYFGNVSWLQVSVIVGDAIILAASLAMMDLWLRLHKTRELWLIVGVAAALYLLLERATTYAPAAYLQNGVLVFNATPGVNIVLAVIIAGIWLPVSALVARVVTHEMKLPGMWLTYAALYATGMVSAILFASAHRVQVVVLAFLALAVSFVMLIASNVVVAKMMQLNQKKKAHGHKARHAA